MVANFSLMTNRFETEVRKWLRQQSEYFCAAGFDALVKRRDKFVSVGGGYIKKCMFFPEVRISHVLRFIFICDLFTDSTTLPVAHQLLRSEILMAAVMKIPVFWVVTPYSLVRLL
jgi:hypothetical protein